MFQDLSLTMCQSDETLNQTRMVELNAIHSYVYVIFIWMGVKEEIKNTPRPLRG